MSRWDDQLTQHDIHATLKQLHEKASKTFDTTDEAHLSEKRRFLKAIETFQEVLKNIDAELTPFGALDNINNQLKSEHVWNHVVAYHDTGVAKSLRRANDFITGLFGQFAEFIAIAKRSEVGRPIQNLEKLFDNFITTISSEKKKLTDSLQKLTEIINQQLAKVEELTIDVENRKKETNDLISNWQAQFSTAQDRRQSEFTDSLRLQAAEINKWRKEIETDTQNSIHDITSKSTAKLESHQNDFSHAMTKFLEQAEEKHKAILELYELTAGDSVASAYIKNANDEKNDANFWRWATILFVVATVVWTGFSYYFGKTVGADSILWVQIIKAFSVTGVLLFGAGYSAKQSNSHRVNEKKARWFALEIKAIDPFIASLDRTDQKALKNKLSERLFGQQPSTNEKDLISADDHLLEVIFKGIVDIIKAK